MLEGFGWPVASPGNTFTMCPRLSSAPNLQKTREVPSFRVLHRPFYGSIGWDDDDGDDNDDSSMCSALAQNMRAGRVPGLDVLPSPRGSAPASFTVAVVDRSASPGFAKNAPASPPDPLKRLQGKTKSFLDNTGEKPPFRRIPNARPGILATTPKRSRAPAFVSSPDFPTSRELPTKGAFVPITSTPLRGTRGNRPQQRSHLSTPVKVSESLTLSDIIQFSDIPSFCLSTPESLCGSSPASSAPLDASNFSRTLVASTLSGDGLLKFAGFKATLTGDTNEDCQPFADTSTSDSSSISWSPSKPWAKRVVGMVKGWLKPSHRRERRRGFHTL